MSEQDQHSYNAMMKVVARAVENQRPLIVEAVKIVKEIRRTDKRLELSEDEMLEVDKKASTYVALLTLAEGYSESINLCALSSGIDYTAN